MSQKMEVIGAWVNAIGTISSAISSTPMRGLKGENRKRWEEISEQLDFGGNSFQAIGNIIEAFLGEPSILEDAGEIIQASGNVTVLFSLLTAEEEDVDKAIKLNITGNAQQAFGGLIATLDEIIGEEVDIPGVMGNFLQSIGNTLQVLSGFVELEIEDLKDLLKETEQVEGQVEEPSDLSDGIIFNELQEYPGRIPEYEAENLLGGISENKGSKLSGGEIFYEIENLFGRIPDYEPSELSDEAILTQAGEPSDLSDGIIFDVLQEVHEETETNPLVKEYEELALILKYSGSWIQAAGSIISVFAEQLELQRVIAEQKESEQKELEEKKNVKRKKKTKKKSSEDLLDLKQKKSADQEYTIFKKKS